MADVRQILATKAFKDAVVLGGHEGLSNTVKTITVAEVPDAADWLRGGEIVCTTGFFVRDSSVSQVQWIESLIQRNAVALAIKTTRFLGDISDAVRVLSDTRKFPIIGLPGNSTWPFVIESVMNLINNEQLLLLQRVQDIHQQLTELVLNGSSVKDIGQALANLVNNPVVVEDGRFNLISANIPVQTDGEPDLEASMSECLLERTDRNYQLSLLNSDYYRRVVAGRSKDTLLQKLPRTRRQTVTIPIIASNVVYGFATLVNASSLHSSIDVAAMEHGATAISLKLIRDTVQLDDRRTTELEAIQDLIHGRLHTAALRNTGFIKIDWSTPMVAILIECRFLRPESDIYVVDRPEQVFEKELRKHIRSVFGQCFLGYDGNLFTLLVPFSPNTRNDMPQKLRTTLEPYLQSLHSSLPIRHLRAAVGGIYASPNMLQQSYEDAQKTLEILTALPNLGLVALHQQIGLFRFIHMINDHNQLRSYRDDYLHELLSHDEKNSDSLCDTLYAYLKLGGNVTATAKELFVHPNTVSYRVRKIHGILGNHFDDPEYRTSLLIALNIHMYLNGKEEN